MLDAFITTSISALITTLVFWLVLRSSKKPRKPGGKYILPWIFGVSGLSIFGYLVMAEMISMLTGAGCIAIVGGAVWALYDAKSFE